MPVGDPVPMSDCEWVPIEILNGEYWGMVLFPTPMVFFFNAAPGHPHKKLPHHAASLKLMATQYASHSLFELESGNLCFGLYGLWQR